MSPGKRETIVKTTEDIPEGEEPQEEPEELRDPDPVDDLPPGIAELFREAGGGGTIEVSRVPASGGQPKYCTSVDPDAFSLAWLKEHWGGGKYYVRAKSDAGRYLKQVTVHVEGRPRHPDSEEEGDGEDRGPRGGLGRLLEDGAVAVELVQTLRAIRDDLRNPPAAAQTANPTEVALHMVQAIQGATAPLLERLLERENDGPDDLERLGRLLEIAEQLRGGGGGDSVASLVRPLVEPIAARLRAGDPPTYSPGGPRPMSSDAPQVNPDPRTPSGRPPDWVHVIRPIVAQVLPLARKDRDPAIYASVILDQIEERPESQALLAFLESATANLGAFLPDFFAWNPEASDHRQWFTRLWVELGIELGTAFDEGEDEEGDSADGGGPELGGPGTEGPAGGNGSGDVASPT